MAWRKNFTKRFTYWRGDVYPPMSKRCRHRVCPDWLIVSILKFFSKSVEISNVVSFRSSDDYLSLDNQWDIGMTAIWVHALGLAPFKDTFWTTRDQPGNPNYGNKTETHPRIVKNFL